MSRTVIVEPRPEPQPLPITVSQRAAQLRRLRHFAFWAVLVAVCFFQTLYGLCRLALGNELYSHIPLIPFISLYLVWIARGKLIGDPASRRGLAIIPFILGSVLLCGYFLGLGRYWNLSPQDYLAVMALAFLAFLYAGLFLFLGRQTIRALAFPAGFLIFIVPFPQPFLNVLESFLQHGSADVAYAMLNLSGLPVLRQGLEFHLPGIALEVAPQCSGIHSTLVLFITSILAAQMFLRRPWVKTVLVLAVVPLALVRNGFRIFTIAQLCVRIGPQMIDSEIHHRGGPIFFLLSLVPFFALLVVLMKSEKKRARLQISKSEISP